MLTDDTTPLALAIRGWCAISGWPVPNRKSAVTWATGYLAPSPDGQKASFFANPSLLPNAKPNNWDSARDHYYKAFTYVIKADREDAFARTFQAVGQVMHLLEDMAVPAHVRNDFESHLAFNGANSMNITTWFNNRFELYVKGHPELVTAASATNNIKIPDLSEERLTSFWDTDQAKCNTLSGNLECGLAEFTNANYLSDSTIQNNDPSSLHSFVYPAITNTNYQICYDMAPENELAQYPGMMRRYISRKSHSASCPSITPERKVDHFAAIGFFSEYDALSTHDVSKLNLRLDSSVHTTYAQELIPRAVGYSAALLNYFFRGDIKLGYNTDSNPGYVIINDTEEEAYGLFALYYDNTNEERTLISSGTFTLAQGEQSDPFDIIPPSDANEPGKYILVFRGWLGHEKDAVAGSVFRRILEITLPDSGIYALVNAEQDPMQFTTVKAQVRNTDTDDAIQNGTIQAVAKYKNTVDDMEFIYSVSASETITGLSTTTEFTFDFTASPIPVNVTDLYLQVIFKGEMGTDDNATAIGEKDVSEPTPIDLFNNKDRVCINNAWYVAGSAEAVAQVDANHNGIAEEWDVYPVAAEDIYIKISSTVNSQSASPAIYDVHIAGLGTNTFKRAAYILTDQEFSYSFYNTWQRLAADDPWDHLDTQYTYTGTALKNQTDLVNDAVSCDGDPPCYDTSYPEYYSYRGSEMWWGGGLIYIIQPYPADSVCE